MMHGPINIRFFHICFMLVPVSAGKSATCFVGQLLLKTHRHVCTRGMCVVFEVINRWHHCLLITQYVVVELKKERAIRIAT